MTLGGYRGKGNEKRESPWKISRVSNYAKSSLVKKSWTIFTYSRVNLAYSWVPCSKCGLKVYPTYFKFITLLVPQVFLLKSIGPAQQWFFIVSGRRVHPYHSATGVLYMLWRWPGTSTSSCCNFSKPFLAQNPVTSTAQTSSVSTVKIKLISSFYKIDQNNSTKSLYSILLFPETTKWMKSWNKKKQRPKLLTL